MAGLDFGSESSLAARSSSSLSGADSFGSIGPLSGSGLSLGFLGVGRSKVAGQALIWREDLKAL